MIQLRLQKVQYKLRNNSIQIYNNIMMQVQRNLEQGQRKRNYSNIPMKKRVLLVKLVLKKGIPLAEAVEELGLKITTARFIINRFKETGTFPRRKFRKNPLQSQKPENCKQEFKQSDEAAMQISKEAQEQRENEKLQAEKGNIKMESLDSNYVWVYNPWPMTMTPYFY